MLRVQVDYGPANETMYCEKLKTNLYRKKPHQCIKYHPQVEHCRIYRVETIYRSL